MWPEFNEYKAALENWLRKHHSDYLKSLTSSDWANAFAEKYHSGVIIIYRNV